MKTDAEWKFAQRARSCSVIGSLLLYYASCNYNLLKNKDANIGIDFALLLVRNTNLMTQVN